ncbi:MAG: murG [Candidatus Saccharibacteria bacterium]|nr:murG [Candidatus Saccharibacteria bacterium]
MYAVRAGKYRRYGNMTRWQKLLDIETRLLNIRDLFYIAVGLVQSYILLGRLKPSIIFTRGGYVSVPVAMGGHAHGIPFITHDSDSTPSLANRLIARWAVKHAVAMPEEAYPYPRSKTVRVGVPVSGEYQPVGLSEQAAAKTKLGLEAFDQIILLTGGGNGAHQLNMALVNAAAELLEQFPKLAIVHLSGRSLLSATREAYQKALHADKLAHVSVEGFTTELASYSAAADVIIARGGATNLAEFAIQGKACVIVPSAQLVWNVRNTELLAKENAVIALSEPESEAPGALTAVLAELLQNTERRQELGRTLGRFARPDAAKALAMVLLDEVTKQKPDDTATPQKT